MGKVSANEALDELRKFHRLFKAFEGAEKVLTVLTGLEQNERELTAAIDKLKADLSATELAAADRRVDLADQIKASEKAAEEAQAAADAAGKETRAATERDALAMREKAQKQVAETLGALEGQIDAATARLDKVKAAVVKAEADLDEKSRELIVAEEKIAAVKAQIANMLGA